MLIRSPCKQPKAATNPPPPPTPYAAARPPSQATPRAASQPNNPNYRDAGRVPQSAPLPQPRRHRQLNTEGTEVTERETEKQDEQLTVPPARAAVPPTAGSAAVGASKLAPPLPARARRWPVATGGAMPGPSPAKRNPWEPVPVFYAAPKGQRRSSLAPTARCEPLPPPLPGRAAFAFAFHGLRCAPPVATSLRPAGARDNARACALAPGVSAVARAAGAGARAADAVFSAAGKLSSAAGAVSSAAGKHFAPAGSVFAPAGKLLAAAKTVFARSRTISSAAKTLFARAKTISSAAKTPSAPARAACSMARSSPDRCRARSTSTTTASSPKIRTSSTSSTCWRGASARKRGDSASTTALE